MVIFFLYSQELLYHGASAAKVTAAREGRKQAKQRAEDNQHAERCVAPGDLGDPGHG